jgi:hypothetical protein
LATHPVFPVPDSFTYSVVPAEPSVLKNSDPTGAVRLPSGEPEPDLIKGVPKKTDPSFRTEKADVPPTLKFKSKEDALDAVSVTFRSIAVGVPVVFQVGKKDAAKLEALPVVWSVIFIPPAEDSIAT